MFSDFCTLKISIKVKTMKKYLFTITLLFISTVIIAQVEKSSKLFKTLKSKDSLLFNIGFNTCDISQFEKLVSNDFEFYQAANIGGVDGLRGYRNERFTGKKSFYQNTDLRLSLGKMRSGILPTAFGLYGGFDYGRVWNPNEDSNVWHTSYGGGFFIDASGLASIRAAVFNSADGIRISFGLGFGF